MNGSAEQEDVSAQRDNAAVDEFASAMKLKLAKARAKGRGGWNDPLQCTNEYLADLLIQHLLKGNAGTFEDVANFAMMLHQRKADPIVLRNAYCTNICGLNLDAMSQLKRALISLGVATPESMEEMSANPSEWVVMLTSAVLELK